MAETKDEHQPETPDPPPTAEELQAYAIDRLEEGARSSDVVAELVDGRLPTDEAKRLVARVLEGMARAQDEQRGTPRSLIGGLLGGIIAAVIAGVAWGAVVFRIEREVGYMALACGLLTAGGVYVCSGRRRGLPFQAAGAVTAVLGVFVGKYVTFYMRYREGLTEQAGPGEPVFVSAWSGDIVGEFLARLTGSLDFMDLLWVALAVVAAAWALKSRRLAPVPDEAEH